MKHNGTRKSHRHSHVQKAVSPIEGRGGDRLRPLSLVRRCSLLGLLISILRSPLDPPFEQFSVLLEAAGKLAEVAPRRERLAPLVHAHLHVAVLVFITLLAGLVLRVRSVDCTCARARCGADVRGYLPVLALIAPSSVSSPSLLLRIFLYNCVVDC